MKKKIYLVSFLAVICFLALFISEPAARGTVSAVPSSVTVTVNQRNVAIRAYNVDGANYFKLRDVAMALNGSAKAFDVRWNASTRTIVLTSRQSYQPVGGELSTVLPAITSIVPSNDNLILDDAPRELAAYTINGNNYFKLRDLCALLGIGVTYSASQNQIQLRTDIDYIRSAFQELVSSNGEYRFLSRYNSKYNYSVDIPAILSSLPFSPTEDALVLYDDSNGSNPYTILSTFARYNALNQTLKEAAEDLFDSVSDFDQKHASIKPISVQGAQSAYKVTYDSGTVMIDAIAAQKNDIFYYVYYFSSSPTLIDNSFSPILADLRAQMEKSLTIY